MQKQRQRLFLADFNDKLSGDRSIGPEMTHEGTQEPEQGGNTELQEETWGAGTFGVTVPAIGSHKEATLLETHQEVEQLETHNVVALRA